MKIYSFSQVAKRIPLLLLFCTLCSAIPKPFVIILYIRAGQMIRAGWHSAPRARPGRASRRRCRRIPGSTRRPSGSPGTSWTRAPWVEFPMRMNKIWYSNISSSSTNIHYSNMNFPIFVHEWVWENLTNVTRFSYVKSQYTGIQKRSKSKILKLTINRNYWN